MCKLKLKYSSKPLIGYLNVNFLKNEIIDVREMAGRLQLYYFVISETKLDSSFLSAQIHISGFEIRNFRGTNKSG